MSACFIGEDELGMLRRILGRKVVWIYGTPFISERELTVASRLAMFAGRSRVANGEYVSFGSERFETSRDGLDYARFRICIADSLGGALGTTGELFVDTSALVDLGHGEVQTIRILAASVDGEDGVIEYDAIIRFELDDGEVLSLGHAPGVYEGVCVTRREAVTLGNPKNLRDRLVLTR